MDVTFVIVSIESSELPLVQELGRLGVHVASVWDLVNEPDTYERAEPLLVEWLQHLDERVPIEDRRRFREGLVRSLT